MTHSARHRLKQRCVLWRGAVRLYFNAVFESIKKCLPKKALLIICLTTLSGVAKGDIINREFQLKAVYLFHFAELAEWPTSSPVSICLQGTSPLGEYLPALEGQLIDGKPVHVRLDQPADISACRILFISQIQALTPNLIEKAKAQHVLLVSDAEGFAKKGGMVEFTLRDNRLKLVINLSAAKKAGIKFSSKLLRMSEILE